MVGTLAGGFRCASSWCSLDLTYDLFIGFDKVYKVNTW